MSRDLERQHCFNRRAAILGGLKLGLFSAIGARLGWLQLIESERFKTLSDKNRVGLRILPAGRGQILDRFGVPLAADVQNFRAFIVSEQSPDIEKTLQSLAAIIPINREERDDVLAEIKRRSRFTPVLVKEGLSWDQMAQIEVNLPDLPGIFVDEGQLRNYPLGTATAHVVGYVGLVSEAEMTDDPIMSLPGFRIGKTGIEKQYDTLLRGKAGAAQVEVNAVGREIRELDRKPGIDGKRTTLTIDAELQLICQERLATEKSASAVIMDIFNGDIYALCSSPGFDPNLFTRSISAEHWEELLADPGVPLTNKAIAGQYPPGSTFKMITALAGLKEGVISSSTRIHCPGYMEFGKDKFRCWKYSGHGKMNLSDALAESCDVYFYDTARKIGIQKIADMARKFGLGEKLGLDMPGEAPGLIPTKEWKRSHFGAPWQIGETVVAGIGQGYIQTTPLQLATMTARLVNGGKAVEPHITRELEGEAYNATNWDNIDVNPAHLKLVLRGMNAVTNKANGTAYSSRIMDSGFSFGGKTGTAQVKRITAEQRARGIQNKDLPWKHRHHALFVGYGPVRNPRYACAVVVEHGVSGSGVAAPIARDLLLATQKRDPASRVAGDVSRPKQKPLRNRG